ncbi:Glu/Leu/Phe/Val dehydrogenase dimerization domain-containing protein [Thermodesulfobacteriota bacterium]
MSTSSFRNDITIEIDLGPQCQGFIYIDTITGDSCSGGIRVYEDISRDEVVALGREMTLKYSFIGLERGASKTGIQLPASFSKEEKARVLEVFGRKMGALIRNGIYYPGTDMNCTIEDLEAVYRGAGLHLGRVSSTSFFTALSAANSLSAIVDFFGMSKPLTIAIEGFGSVAADLAKRLPAETFKIVAVSTIEGAIYSEAGLFAADLLRLRNKYGDTFVRHVPDAESIEKPDIFHLPVDIFMPGARTWSVNPQNMEKIKAKFIVPVANAPYADGAAEFLQENGITCLPGFVVNSGAVFASTLFDSGIPLDKIENLGANEFTDVVRALLVSEKENGRSPVVIAQKIAQERIAEYIAGGKSKIKIDNYMKKLYRKKIIPRFIYSRFVYSRFRKNLQNLKLQVKNFIP